jgi:putative two-component system response regulator
MSPLASYGASSGTNSGERSHLVLSPLLDSPQWENALEEVSHTPTILLVDPAEINRRLLKAILKGSEYRILEAARPLSALLILERERVDVVMVDLAIPEMSAHEFCLTLKNNPATQLIPIIMTTSFLNTENEIAGIDSGADDFLVKPLRPDLVRTRVRSMLRTKALTDSLEQAETILFALAQSVEHRDPCTGMHCERLAAYSLALGQTLGLPKRDLQALNRAGYLHDIGKISIPDSILFKPGPLNEHDWEIMRQHTVRGEEICRPLKSLAPVLPIIRSHHERWDGSGYPDGLRGEQIPLLARILQVVDIYDALTTARPYKPAFSHAQALVILDDEARRGWRDPELVQLFALTVPDFGAVELGKVEPPSFASAPPIVSSALQSSLENMRRALTE